MLLQYDVADWARYASPLSEAAPHHWTALLRLPPRSSCAPATPSYGVQNLAYDESLQRWFMRVYPGKKTAFPNYGLFAVICRRQARESRSGRRPRSRRPRLGKRARSCPSRPTA
ncbi:hypothetical protein ACRAWD_29635 [Caulobacter segnis]